MLPVMYLRLKAGPRSAPPQRAPHWIPPNPPNVGTRCCPQSKETHRDNAANAFPKTTPKRPHRCYSGPGSRLCPRGLQGCTTVDGKKDCWKGKVQDGLLLGNIRRIPGRRARLRLVRRPAVQRGKDCYRKTDPRGGSGKLYRTVDRLR